MSYVLTVSDYFISLKVIPLWRENHMYLILMLRWWWEPPHSDPGEETFFGEEGGFFEICRVENWLWMPLYTGKSYLSKANIFQLLLLSVLKNIFRCLVKTKPARSSWSLWTVFRGLFNGIAHIALIN